MSVRIAFSGQARVGKDMAADYLQSKHPGQRLRFATKMHDICRQMHDTLGWPYEKDRELLQFIGTDWGRRKDDRIWINPILEVVAADPEPNYFLSDCRFTNEADALKAAGFVLVRIERRDLPDPNGAWRKHSSERDLDNYAGWDFLLQNCGTREHYQGQLDTLWNEIITGQHKLQHFSTKRIA